jgi:hypothetical protein
LQEKAVALAQGGRQAHFKKSSTVTRPENIPTTSVSANSGTRSSESIAQKDWDNAERALAPIRKAAAAHRDHLGPPISDPGGRGDFDGAYNLAMRFE